MAGDYGRLAGERFRLVSVALPFINGDRIDSQGALFYQDAERPPGNAISTGLPRARPQCASRDTRGARRPRRKLTWPGFGAATRRIDT